METFLLPVVLDKPVHEPHLDNFFSAMRGNAQLSSPADAAFRAEVVALKINEAIDVNKLIPLTAEEFVAD